VLCTTLTKASAIVNEAAQVCVLKNMGVLAQVRMKNWQWFDIES
jgi:hypothetical protein